MSVVRYKENPFIKDLALTISSKRVMISPMGKDEHVLVNQSTGEVTGTNVVTYKKVDNEEFVKLFSRNIALTFELTSSGIKSLNVLIWSVQNTAIQKDVVALDQLAFDDFMKENPNLKMTLRTFQRGLSELESSKIIAKTMRKGFYYINPNFVFNGDRIAFTTLIERK
ncbi:replication/maintenance protein RepL [Shigella sonnei]|uniref:replication/maintenance protein RepL n=1 Tax=Escherichia coli TaxID=562 RepID=UPI00225A9F9C|nr:replication/maintenance protein RepL [Escherichia coli]HCN2662367.1 replication/maintenance protein RepL [Escherichia coli]HEA0922317.1 replication/maintenance protein RepL [Escherichia coli]